LGEYSAARYSVKLNPPARPSARQARVADKVARAPSKACMGAFTSEDFIMLRADGT